MSCLGQRYIRWVISETVLGGKYLGVLIVPAVVIHSIYVRGFNEFKKMKGFYYFLMIFLRFF